MRTMEEIRKSNEETLAAFDGAIAERQALLLQYQELNRQSLTLNDLMVSASSETTQNIVKHA